MSDDNQFDTMVQMTDVPLTGPPLKEGKPRLTKRLIDLAPSSLQKKQLKSGRQVTQVGNEMVENWWPDNTVTSKKYTFWNFVPINLFGVQLMKLSNIYFLIVAVMQVIPAISITEGKPAMVPPLCIVIIASMIKDAFEDYVRYKQDCQGNNEITLVYDKMARKFQERPWSAVRVGDLVKVTKGMPMFPSDMILVHSDSDDGYCYVETKSLDGESNLKLRRAKTELNTAYGTDRALQTFHGQIECDAPNNQLYKCNITMMQKSNKKLTLDIDNMCLRGMSLKNTNSVVGCVVYTGRETKIQKNLEKPRYKESKIMKSTNTKITFIFFSQIFLSISGAVIGMFWQIPNYATHDYLGFNESECQPSVLKLFINRCGIWFLMFTNFVAISLLVTLELVKFWQARFIEVDKYMIDEEHKIFTKTLGSNLNEELGQIEYIFSDKTGTLTKNEMTFYKFTTGRRSYDVSNRTTSDQQISEKRFYQENTDTFNKNSSISNFEFPHSVLLNTIKTASTDPDQTQSKKEAYTLLRHLSMCHQTIVDPATKQYSSPSPDDLALVQGAQKAGIEFLGQDPSTGSLRVRSQRVEEECKLLHTLEFTSDRKRMSVIIKKQNGQIEMLAKGADSVIKELLTKDTDQGVLDQTLEMVETYAESGLRTLLLARRDISAAEYEQFSYQIETIRDTRRGMDDLDELIEQVYTEIEQNLILVGATAIEDCLQEECKTTIQSLKAAGIKVWVLTGDKVATAVNIGFSAGLLDQETEQYVVREREYRSMLAAFSKCEKQFSQNTVKKKHALIIDGEALTVIDGSEILQGRFLEFTSKINVVIACRFAPKQKATIIRLVKSKYPKASTLAIGDGANDVAMINEADVGVGISGHEGMQAARASDYAVGQFKLLQPLLFIHGRECYRRNSDLVCYTFYKNMLYIITQLWYGIFSVFAGQTLYEPYIYQCYNIFFVGLSIMYYAAMDFEFDKEFLMREPKLYAIGLKNTKFSNSTFWGWVAYAWIQAFFVYWICFATISQQPLWNGKSYHLIPSGQNVYLCCIIIANLTILQLHNSYSGWAELLMFLQVASYFVLYFGMNNFPSINNIYGLWEEQMSNPVAWLALIFAVSSLWTINRILKISCEGIQALFGQSSPQTNSYEVKKLFGSADDLVYSEEANFGEARVSQSGEDESASSHHANVKRYLKNLQILRNAQVCVNMSHDSWLVNTFLVFGNAFPKQMDPNLKQAFQQVIQFTAKIGLRYRILYFGSLASVENSQRVWDLLKSCGPLSVARIENFIFIGMPRQHGCASKCCKKNPPPSWAREASLLRYESVKEFMKIYYNNRDPEMCVRIFKILPRGIAEKFDSENQQTTTWNVPSHEEATKQARQMKKRRTSFNAAADARYQPLNGGFLEDMDTQKSVAGEVLVPKIFFLLTNYFKNRPQHFKEVNLFSKKCSSKVLGELSQHFTFCDYEIIKDLQQKPHEVACFIKKVLEEMAEPICTFQLYDPFMQVMFLPDQERKIEHIQNLLNMRELPSLNRNTLGCLLSMLNKVSEYSAVNNMTTHKLSLIFSPLLWWSQSQDPKVEQENLQTKIDLCELMMKNVNRLFSDTEMSPRNQIQVPPYQSKKLKSYEEEPNDDQSSRDLALSLADGLAHQRSFSDYNNTESMKIILERQLGTQVEFEKLGLFVKRASKFAYQKEKMTYLQFVICKQNTKLFELLMQDKSCGRDELLRGKDKAGNTCLHYLAQANNKEMTATVVQILDELSKSDEGDQQVRDFLGAKNINGETCFDLQVISENQNFQNQPFFEGKIKRKPQQQQHANNRYPTISAVDDIEKANGQALDFSSDSN